ncbi:hypothetical protein EVG20_g10658 [Dentipellis fragilis]|uniref:F-box domain-containing protein n=1 Tax=Dentipellis fragilis TaxID=205917 RepID=A0A4Y9XUH5_9AGAM|nr:hypothetical protein EVG20_g10658 [Dentipellis fragilis]
MTRPNSDASEGHAILALIEAERTRLQDELTQVVKSANVIQARINALGPLSRLPSEILVVIFRCLAGIQTTATFRPRTTVLNCKSGTTPRILTLGWILVTHVCRQWRQVAIDHALLWTHISFALGSDWAERMLERSKMVPLVVREWNSATALYPDVLELLRHHLPHIHTFELCRPSDILEEVLPFLNQNAPMMHTLQLGTKNPAKNISIVVTPDDFLNQHAPSLRKLVLEDVLIPWTSPLFNNLEYLAVKLTAYEDEDRFDETASHWEPTLPGFLDVLEAMPGLKTLSLIGAAVPFTTVLSILNNNNRTVSLPNLGNATLRSQPRDVAVLLDHLELPRTVKLAFSCDCRDDIEEWLVLFTSIARYLSRTELLTITDLDIEDQFGAGMLISAHTAPNSTGKDDHTVFSIHFPYNGILWQLTEIMPLFFGTVPFHSLLSLNVIGGYHHFSRYPCWRDIFRGLRSVRSFKAFVNEMYTLMEYLWSGPEGSVVFPDLEVLRIPDFWNILQESEHDPIRNMQERVRMVLESRQSHAPPLKKLVLGGDNPEDISLVTPRLKGLVSEVTIELLRKPKRPNKINVWHGPQF